MASPASQLDIVPMPKIRDLISIAGKLVILLREETTALRSFALTRVGELAAEKANLSESYSSMALRFRKDPETLKAVTTAVHSELREVIDSFETAARENEQALSVARDANQRVLRAIVEAAETQRPKAQGYGPNGLSVAAGGRRSAAGMSVALNRQL